MGTPRIYQPSPLAVNQLQLLSIAASHHVLHVLRLRVGDPLLVFNGEGGEFCATLHAIVNKKQIQVVLQQHVPREAESPLLVHLGQAVARGQKMDFIVQKAVELGVQSITPLLTERSGVKLSAERWQQRMAHWQQVAISASEQCGRNRLLQIAPPQSLTTWLQHRTTDVCVMLDPSASNTLRDVPDPGAAPLCLLVGSEGGFSVDELAQARAATFMPLRLGTRVLRTETAALAALAALQQRWGDF